MNFLNDISALGIIRCWGGLPFLFVLTLVVFFHELGHFLIARLCGVRVSVFSIGFGPELLGFNVRSAHGWNIAAPASSGEFSLAAMRLEDAS